MRIFARTLAPVLFAGALFGQQIPRNSSVVVRTTEAIESSSADQSRSYRATLDEPIVSEGKTIAPKGAEAVLKVVDSKSAGRVKGRAELSVALASVSVDGKMTDVNTESVSTKGGSRGKRTGVGTGIGAGVGAAIGAIAGGGKGAAIGAGAGGAAGAGTAIMTGGTKVKIPAETRLTFVVD